MHRIPKTDDAAVAAVAAEEAERARRLGLTRERQTPSGAGRPDDAFRLGRQLAQHEETRRLRRRSTLWRIASLSALGSLSLAVTMLAILGTKRNGLTVREVRHPAPSTTLTHAPEPAPDQGVTPIPVATNGIPAAAVHVADEKISTLAPTPTSSSSPPAPSAPAADTLPADLMTAPSAPRAIDPALFRRLRDRLAHATSGIDLLSRDLGERETAIAINQRRLTYLPDRQPPLGAVEQLAEATRHWAGAYDNQKERLYLEVQNWQAEVNNLRRMLAHDGEIAASLRGRLATAIEQRDGIQAELDALMRPAP